MKKPPGNHGLVQKIGTTEMGLGDFVDSSTQLMQGVMVNFRSSLRKATSKEEDITPEDMLHFQVQDSMVTTVMSALSNALKTHTDAYKVEADNARG